MFNQQSYAMLTIDSGSPSGNDQTTDDNDARSELRNWMKCLAIVAVMLLISAPLLLISNQNGGYDLQSILRHLFGIIVGTIAGVAVIALLLFLGRMSQARMNDQVTNDRINGTHLKEDFSTRSSKKSVAISDTSQLVSASNI